jgi:hypothetical protein
MKKWRITKNDSMQARNVTYLIDVVTDIIPPFEIRIPLDLSMTKPLWHRRWHRASQRSATAVEGYSSGCAPECS